MVRIVIAILLIGLLIVTVPSLLASQVDDASTKTVVLYDGRLGSRMDAQGFSYTAFGPTNTVQFIEGITVLNTLGEIKEQAGYFSSQPLTLDRNAGYTVRFDVQISEETHAGRHRAGFSVIVISEDLLGLELAFWENEVWVQEGGTGDSLFKHAEGAVLDTTADRISYELQVSGDFYTLTADGQGLLNGPLRDYTAFDGFPDPYELPSLLFMGDNTRRGGAQVGVAYVAVESRIVAETAAPPTETGTPTPGWLLPTVTEGVSAQPTGTRQPEPAAVRSDGYSGIKYWELCAKGKPETD